MTSEAKLTNTPQQAVSRTSARLSLRRLGGRLRTAGVAMNCGSLCSLAMGFIAHGMNAAGVNPAVVKIEEGADGDRVVDGLIGVPGGMQQLNIGRTYGDGIFIHF